MEFDLTCSYALTVDQERYRSFHSTPLNLRQSISSMYCFLFKGTLELNMFLFVKTLMATT